MTSQLIEKVIIFVLLSMILPAYTGALPGPLRANLELIPQIGVTAEDMLLGEFQSIDFSPDGKTIATGNELGFIQLWSSQGYLLRVWRPETQGGGVKFSNSGKLLASYIMPYAKVYIWDPRSGSLMSQFGLRGVLRQEEIKRVDFSPDDSLLALAGDHYIVVWDLAKNAPRLTISSYQGKRSQVGAPHSVYFAASGNSIVGNSGDTVKIWDLQGRLSKTIQVNGLTDFVVPKAGKEIVCRSTGAVTVWNLEGVLLDKFSIGLGKYADNGLFSRVAYLSGENAVLTTGASGISAWTRKGRLLWKVESKAPRESDNPCELRSSDDGKNFAIRTCDGEMRIWDATAGAMKDLALKAIDPILDFEFFPERGIVTSSMKVLERTGKLEADLGYNAVYMTASPDGRLLAVSTKERQVKLYDQQWNLLNKFHGGAKDANERLLPVSFSQDSKMLAVYEDPGIVIYDCSTGRIVSEIPLEPYFSGTQDERGYVAELHFMPDAKTLLIGYTFGPLVLVDIESKKKLFPQNMPRNGLTLADPNSNVIIMDDGSFGTAYGGEIRFWDGKGRELRSIPISMPSLSSNFPKLAYNPVNKLIVIGGWGGESEVLDSVSGKDVKILPLHFAPITRLRFSPDGSQLLVSSEDGMLKIWDTRGWDSAAILTTKSNEWLIYSPDGYFDASPHGGELVAMVNGLDAYGIEQFAARNNRPDIILERMRLGTSEQISHYQLLYQRRLEKLGLTEAMLQGEPHVPEAKILKAARNGKFVDVGFELSDLKYQLKRFNIFVNNVPLFAPTGKEIRGHTFSGTEKVELGAGENKIEVSVMNSIGIESYRAVTYAKLNSAEPGDLYYLGFGISEFKDASIALAYPDKDVKDLGAELLKMGKSYGNIFSKILVNSDVTEDNILKAKGFFKNAKVDDTVVILVAGHGGYTKGAAPKYYYLPYSADMVNLEKTGVAFQEIEGLLADIKPRKKILLMDTCESGELEDEVFAKYIAMANERGIRARTFRKPVKKRSIGKDARRGYLLEKDRYIYNNLARRTGAVIFSSSRGNEMSYESPVIKNGFFTRAIISALFSNSADTDRNGGISVDELKVYVRDAVSRDTGGLQHPTIDWDNLAQKIELPALRR